MTDAGETLGIVLGVAGIVVTAAFSIWATNDARNQVGRFIRTAQSLAWKKLLIELAWCFVDPTGPSYSRDADKGLSDFIFLSQELDPEKKTEALKGAAENEALALAESLVAGGKATWKPELDMERIQQKLKEWRKEKDRVRTTTPK